MSDTDGDLNDDIGNDINQDSEGYPTWMSQLPDEYKKDAYGKGYKTMGEFYKTHKGLRAKLDAVPTAPEKADDYEFKAPEEDADFKPDPKTEKWFRKMAFSLKLPKEVTEKLYGEYNKMAMELIKAKEKTNASTTTKNDELMHGEWGDEYDANMKLVEKGIAELGGDDLEKLLTDTGLRNHPAILKAFKQIGFEHSDDTIKSGTISGTPGERTLDDEYPSMKDVPDKR